MVAYVGGDDPGSSAPMTACQFVFVLINFSSFFSIHTCSYSTTPFFFFFFFFFSSFFFILSYHV